MALLVAGVLALVAVGRASAERGAETSLRTTFQRDLVRDRNSHPTDRLNRPDARTVKVKVSPHVRDGVQGVMATARLASGAVIGRAAELDAKTGKLIRFLGNWGFVGRFAAPPGGKK